jgi:DHA2 family multidrug resistance protein-like MFS transporter
LGAAILSVSSWPWLFAVNLPIGILVLAAARALPSVKGTDQPLDLASVALNGSMFAALVAGSEWAATRPVLAGVLFAVGGLSAAALVRRERRRSAPLIPLDLLRHAPFRVSVIASVLLFTGQTAGVLALTFHLQHGLGLSLPAAGLYLTLWPLTVAVVAPVAGRLADRMATAWLCLAGGIGLALGLAAASACSTPTQPLILGACIIACGLGFGLFNVPNNRSMFLAAPRARSGAAGGAQGVARLTGQMAGAVATTLLLTFAPLEAAARIGLVLGAALTAAAGLTSLLRIGGGERLETA